MEHPDFTEISTVWIIAGADSLVIAPVADVHHGFHHPNQPLHQLAASSLIEAQMDF